MNCPSELICSRYVDNALAAEQSRALESHLAGCGTCRALVGALTRERNLLRSTMQAAAAGGVIPAFVPRPTISRLLVWLGWTALAFWAVGTVWLSLVNSLSPPSWFAWLSPSTTGTGIEFLLSTVMAGSGGVTMLDGIMAAARSAAVATIALLGFGWLVRHQPGRTGTPVVALGILGVLITAAPEGQAFELRRDEQRVTVGPDEVIDDTLIVSAEDVAIEGRVTGDLIAFGESLSIRGQVDGLVIAIGESVRIEGTLGQSALGIGETVEVRDAVLGGNFYGAGERVILAQSVEITGNAITAGEETEVHGAVGKDLISAGRRVTLFGAVGRNMRGYGKTVELTGTARVAGNLAVKAESTEAAIIAPGANVAGDTGISVWPDEPNPYTSIDFYLGQILQILAAFITGLVLFRLSPELSRVELEGSMEALVTAAIGAVILIGTPVLSLVAIATLIGAPLGLVSLMIWLAALYAAGIVIACYVGRLLLPGHGDGRALPLLIGLTILVAFSEIPFLGGPVKLVAGVLGLGLIAQWLRARWESRFA